MGEASLSKLSRYLSIALYVLALTQPSFCTEVACGEGFEGLLLLIIGVIGLTSSPAGITWLANIAIFFSWGFQKKPKQALLSSALAVSLCFSFLFFKQVMRDDSGAMTTVTNYQLGYWLWLGSAISILVSSVTAYKQQKTSDNNEVNRYKGMSVYERLYVSGLSTSFEEAVGNQDIETVSSILTSVGLSDESIKPILDSYGLNAGFSTITSEQKNWLDNIAPSNDNGILYYPCSVTLKDKSVIENVYLVELNSYQRHWGVQPKDDNAKRSIPIEDVVSIENSPNRLPVHLANKLYEAGESGMGYCVFKIIYDNGDTLDVSAGNAVDFVPSTEGLTAANIIDVLPHQGSRRQFVRGPEYYWCLYRD